MIDFISGKHEQAWEECISVYGFLPPRLGLTPETVAAGATTVAVCAPAQRSHERIREALALAKIQTPAIIAHVGGRNH